ncbi:restriction endonuclease subunit S [Bacillus safensis]|uniref:restriction endonuclease subunit S n=1 Tax=Bacillus safensis TaxID=561879 RepID=UPI001CC9C5B2|nr:restriction endonuclease subunit S [Bacillus safensis]MBZ9520375.1 restriction endonuclease subunit S [Bacillus safensis]
MNIPNLRFKEFNTPWKPYLLKDLVISLEAGVSVNSKDTPVNNLKIGVLKTSCISNGVFFPEENKQVLDEEVNRVKKSVKRNTLIISRMNTPQLVGEIGYVEKDYENLFLPDRLWELVPDTNLINAKWLASILTSTKYKFLIQSLGTGTSNSMKNIAKTELLNLFINIPAIEEQDKISALIGAMDRKIRLQQEKISLLEEKKKGYMKKIFSQNQNGWFLSKLGDLFEERSEKGYEEYQLLAVTLGNGVTDRTGMKKDTSSEDKSNYKRVLPDDIAYNSMRMWQGASGHSKYKGIVSPAYTVLKPKKRVYSLFFAYLFKTDYMLYQFKKYSQGLTSDTWNLKYPLLKDIKVKVPSYEEQKKIASLFSKLDLKIQLETKKLGILQEQKKGFMQQMFI